MKITSSMLLNIILLMILSASFFLVNTTANTSRYETKSIPEYDPWIDYDDDGDIDLYDAIELLIRYGSKGTPINKTALLYNVNDTFTQLLNRIDNLTARVEELEIKVDSLNATKLGQPDYDSNWTLIFEGDNPMPAHNLNTKEVIVYMIGKKTVYGDYHQIDYGGVEPISGMSGAYWHELTTTTITVHRNNNDANWNYVRIMMWKIPEP